VLFETAGLPKGTYRGNITIEDPNAVDAPQYVPIKVYVGGNVPEESDFYVRPAEGSSQWMEFETPEPAQPSRATTLTSSAPGFLSVSTSGNGSFQFIYTHRITATYRPGMAVGESSTIATVAGSSFAADNRAIPVRVHVTNDPIAQPSAQELPIVTAQEIDAPVQAIVLSNRGNGTLSVSDVTVETDSGEWLSVEESTALQASGGGPDQAAGPPIYLVTANQEGLEPGVYTGTITFTSNAANSPTEVSVVFEVAEQKPPLLSYRGAVNGATFSPNQPLAQGAIVSVFGTQLAYSVEGATETPLPRELGATKVVIGGVEAPLFYASWGQVNFQVPNEVPQGVTTLQVLRDGQASNRISVTVANRTPGLFLLNLGLYGAIVNGSASARENKTMYPIPRDLAVSAGLDGAPARPGDVLVIFATGLGPVAPGVPTGQVAPSQEPLARGLENPTVNIGRSFLPALQTPQFVGLTPGFVGLFQINVAIPDTAPTNPRTALSVEYPGGAISNTVEIAVEQ
jgi:uncharacterized protein (TIGR03437 family)